MPELICPKCQAVLQDDLIESTGQAECPFCGADISKLNWPESSRLPPPPASFEEATPTGPRYEEHAGSSPARPIITLPANRVQVVEDGSDREVFFIPPGGPGAAAIGFFALLWNGFMAVFTVVMVFTGKNLPLAPYGLISLCWVVGLGFAFWWLRMRYERTLVLLEPERLAIQWILFGWKRQTELPLGNQSRAELVEAYSQNNSPVYCVSVRGERGTARFGTALSDAEKDWFVDQINAFLGAKPALVEDAAAVTTSLDHQDAERILTDAGYELTEPEPGRSQIAFSVKSLGVKRGLFLTFVGGFTLIWYGFLAGMVGHELAGKKDLAQMLPLLLFLIPFALAGLMPLTLALFIWGGRATLSITDQSAAAWVGVGRLGYSRVFPLASITRISTRQRARSARRPGYHKTWENMCLLHAGTQTLPLMAQSDPHVAAAMCIYLQRQFHARGYAVPHE